MHFTTKFPPPNLGFNFPGLVEAENLVTIGSDWAFGMTLPLFLSVAYLVEDIGADRAIEMLTISGAGAVARDMTYCVHAYRDDTASTIRHTSATSANMASTALIDADMAPTLQSILDQKTLRWIFVGGKGGVGKTTTSCSLAIQLAKHRKSVLLISTDPAHNLSDAFNQKFGKDARLVNGFDNLSAMEIDPNGSIQDLLASGAEEGQDPMAGLGGMGSMMQDLAFSIPGVDEAMSFAEVLKQVKSMSYEVIIFDTAPTGHTLRFLQFPTVMEKALSKVSQLSRQFGPMLNSFLGGSGRLPNGQNMDELVEKMENLRETIGEVNGQFKDADLTTFVCVCIPEFLSLYETERMIQELNSYEIDTHSIVVNQLLFPKQDNPCEQCNARRKMQKKYLDQIEELYDEFNVVKMPLLVEEVRGKEKLEKFSEMLVKPFVPPQ
ncbi:ATPase [Alternaria tenuissima]|uniref:ATPase n=2 Tax=Alternaria alternata complex TaxID=187734 RepID=A0A4Q4N041_ALTAL|nr:ATPase [Alternaria alternata]RYN94327.1 ATPase [Alternaria tenuissima]